MNLDNIKKLYNNPITNPYTHDENGFMSFLDKYNVSKDDLNYFSKGDDPIFKKFADLTEKVNEQAKNEEIQTDSGMIKGLDMPPMSVLPVSDMLKIGKIPEISLDQLVNNTNNSLNNANKYVKGMVSDQQGSYEVILNPDTSVENGELIVSVPRLNKLNQNHKNATPSPNNTQPWDVRLQRSDLFLNGYDRVPFASDEAAPIISDLIDYSFDSAKSKRKHPGHVIPASKNQYRTLINDSNLWGTLSIINPYSVTRLYGGLKNIHVDGKYATARENRMLDIRDQKRFYDQKVTNSNDNLSVSNPTTTNIIELMCNDKWGRTPYTFQDFVFCKWWNKIPNNRMITLRKYAAPTQDNLCWELMDSDRKKGMPGKFAPIATAVTYFGDGTGNNLGDILSISSGLPWKETEKAKIWDVTGDAGDIDTNIPAAKMLATGGAGMQNVEGGLSRVFSSLGTITNKSLSFLKFFSMVKSPYAFDQQAATQDQFLQGIHDPNENGPYANRIVGPINRIDQVYRREEGLNFEHKISLKFSYEARPIGGMNTKAVMLDILSNLLMMCSATAVFWGGGHRFKVTPHAYPWTSSMSPGLAKDIYNGNFFGDTGAIAKVMNGLIKAGGTDGGWSWDNAAKMLANLGTSVLGVLSGAVNTMLGSISNKLADAANNLLENVGIGGSAAGNSAAFKQGQTIFTNIMKNTQAIWRSNSIKSTVLPHIEGLRSILIGEPVGNFHLTIGNPLNPIAVIGNLICRDIKFKFGEELGPDDFPTTLEATITLDHGMKRDLAAIESMFNKGAGRIYQAPDYVRMFGGQVSSDQESRVDAVTGGTSSRMPARFVRVEGNRTNYPYASSDMDSGHRPSNEGKDSKNLNTPLNNIDVIDFGYGANVPYSRQNTNIRSAIAGNWATRKYADE